MDASVADREESKASSSSTTGSVGSGSDGSASVGGVDSAGDEEDEEEGGMFECNICLEAASDPVTTQCGHLFCWPCLFEWLSRNAEPGQRAEEAAAECPVCKAGVTADNVIPLYGRGSSKKKRGDPRRRRPHSAASGGDGGDASIPNRPAGRRPQAPPRRNRQQQQQQNANGFGAFNNTGFFGQQVNMGPGVTFSAGFGLFPALLFSFGNVTQPGNANNDPNVPPETEQNVFLSKLLMVVGIIVIFFLLLF